MLSTGREKSRPIRIGSSPYRIVMIKGEEVNNIMPKKVREKCHPR